MFCNSYFMTLIAAINQKKGIVIVSDRKMVDLNSRTAPSEAQKLFQLNHNSGIGIYGGIPSYKGMPIPLEEVIKCLLEHKMTNKDFSQALEAIQKTLNEVLKPISNQEFLRFKEALMNKKYDGVKEINNISIIISNDGVMKYLIEYTTDRGKAGSLESPLETINIFGLSFNANRCEEFQIGSFTLPSNCFKVNTVQNHSTFTGVCFKGSQDATSLAKEVLCPNKSLDPRVNYCKSLFTAKSSPIDKSFWNTQRDLDDYPPMLSHLISGVSKTEELFPPVTGFSTVGGKPITAQITNKGFEWVDEFKA